MIVASPRTRAARPFCGLGAFVGTGPTVRAHVYTAANLDEITLDSHKKMDAVRLAKQFEVDMCAVNGGRYWLMDETDIQGGDVVNFDGVNLLYGGEMTGGRDDGADGQRRIRPT